MRSKTSFFSRGIARKSVTRYWPVWAAYLAVWILFMPAALWSSRYYGDALSLPDRCNGTVIGFTGMAAAIMTSVGAIFAAWAVWSYLFNPRAAVFYHTLPVRREGLFVTQYLTGLGFLCVPALATAVVTYGTELALGYTGGLFYLCEWLAVVLLLSVFFFSLATFCAFLTGHTVALPILYFLFNFAVVVVEYLVRDALSTFLIGVRIGSPRLAAFSPLVCLYYSANSDYSDPVSHYDEFGYLGLLALAAAILVTCALLLYRRRHIESAQDVIAVPFLRPVFRILFALGCSVVLGSAFFRLVDGEGRLIYTLCVLLGGLIGYLAAEMLLRKSFRVLRACWKRLCLLLAAVLVLVSCITFDVLGIAKWTPAPEDVDYVILNEERFSDTDEIASVINLHAMSQKMEPVNGGEPLCSVNLTYVLKDGRSVCRDYSFRYDLSDLTDPSTPAGLSNALLTTEKVLSSRLLPPQGSRVYTLEVEHFLYDAGETLEIREEDYEAFFAAVRRDALEGTLGHWEIYALSRNEDTVIASVRIEYRPSANASVQALCWDIRDCDENLSSFMKTNGYWK